MARYIDADAFASRMYHEAFEKDSDMQKWDSGCWIRYRLFEEVLRGQPTVHPEPHWTPVEQALPKKDGRYYVTLENKYVEILYYAVEQTIRHPKGFYYLSEDGRMTWRQTQNPVIAWCELLEPFNEVTE